MTRGNTERISLMVVLVLCLAGMAAAQDDQSPPAPSAPAAPPPVTYGQESSAPTVNENPPISAIDLPGLDPHAAPESFLVPGVHVSESVDSNQQNQLGGSDVGSITRALGSLSLLKLWKHYGLALDYVGGIADYTRSQVGVAQIQQLDFDNRITWKRGQIGIRDAFSYLPEGTFGGGAYGGSAALASVGSSFLGAGGFGANSTFFGATNFGLGTTPRLMNLGMVDASENLTPKSAVTAAAGFDLVHYMGVSTEETGESIPYIGSREYSGMAAYDRILTPKDQVALSYGYQAFDFSVVDANFHDNVIQAMYGHRVSGRMDFLIAAGPQFSHFGEVVNLFGIITLPLGVNRIGVAGRAILRYRFPKTTLDASFLRYETSGSGVFAGAESNIARLDLTRPLGRVWGMFTDVGWAKNTRLQSVSTVNATSFDNLYAGIGAHRLFGRSLRLYMSYQFNDLYFNNSCPLPGTSGAGCSNHSYRQVGTIGLDWNPRPIRLD